MADLVRDPALGPVLRRLRIRQRWRRAIQGCGRGLFYGTLLAAAVTAATALAGVSWSAPLPWAALACIPAVAVLLGLVGTMRPVNPLRLARALDRAADADDRFASACQLANHWRRERARLVKEDALASIGATSAAAALPIRAPREVKWLPLPLLALGAALWLSLVFRPVAQAADPPEISPDQWAQLEDEFRRELAAFRPRTAQQEQVLRQLEELASLLSRKPDKKEALAQIARVRAGLEEARQGLGAAAVSPQKAAAAMSASRTLSPLARQLQSGDYEKAVEELRRLSQQLKESSLKMDAAEFEAAQADLGNLAKELSPHEALGPACLKCASAAGSMNSRDLADALSRLADAFQQSAEQLHQCDGVAKACSLVDQLQRRMNACKSCGHCGKPGCSVCQGAGGNPFLANNNRKGGLKAGWGTAANWSGGALEARKEDRLPTLAETQERSGASTGYSTVSKDERAVSGQEYKDLYVEMIRKAEADLALDDVPVAYREFLRRYFAAIQPQEDTGASEPADDGQSGGAGGGEAP